MLSLNDAQHLCKHYSSKYKPTDFLTFGGFCSWRPSQLEYEMGEERGEWMALSVDDVSIWEELQLLYNNAQSMKQLPNVQTSRGLLESGTTMWRIFLSMVNVTEEKATERLPSKQLAFYDLMLTVWAEENLSTGTNNDDDDDDTSAGGIMDDETLLKQVTKAQLQDLCSQCSLSFTNGETKKELLLKLRKHAQEQAEVDTQKRQERKERIERGYDLKKDEEEDEEEAISRAKHKIIQGDNDDEDEEEENDMQGVFYFQAPPGFFTEEELNRTSTKVTSTVISDQKGSNNPITAPPPHQEKVIKMEFEQLQLIPPRIVMI
mmetsp:Transcript_13460/g.19919  ORF Transcript_13460/g.19919 Transcript_13460/m.19919 type:complete len:319 (+) Transcript_13460:713-1669(+)